MSLMLSRSMHFTATVRSCRVDRTRGKPGQPGGEALADLPAQEQDQRLPHQEVEAHAKQVGRSSVGLGNDPGKVGNEVAVRGHVEELLVALVFQMSLGVGKCQLVIL